MRDDMERQLVAGKAWVEKTVLRYANEFRVPAEISPRAWSDEQESSDRTKDRIRLVPLVNGKLRRDKGLVFKVEDLTDIPGTKSLRAELEETIKKVVKSWAPKPRRIGF